MAGWPGDWGDRRQHVGCRVTLNPIKHIDPFDTNPDSAAVRVRRLPLIGWAKPTPVTTRNFKHIKRDDILTTLAGPASNLPTAIVALVILIVLKHFDPAPVWAIVTGAVSPGTMNGSPVLFPVALLLYYAVLLNLMLMAFNLIPLPPLDGSHIVRHMLPYNWLRVYDSIGMIGLVVIFVFGGRFIDGIVGPVLSVFNHILLSM